MPALAPSALVWIVHLLAVLAVHGATAE